MTAGMTRTTSEKALPDSGREGWKLFRDSLDMWMASFRQTLGACLAAARGEEEVSSEPVPYQSFVFLMNGDASKLAEGRFIDFSGVSDIRPAEQGAGAGMKTALLAVDEDGQDRIIERAEEKMKQFGLRAAEVMKSALGEAATLIGTYSAEMYGRLKRKGVPGKERKAMSAKMAACALAAAIMIYGCGPALGNAGITDEKVLKGMSSERQVSEVLGELSSAGDAELHIVLMKVLGADWTASISSSGFREASAVMEREIPDAVRDCAARELRTKTYSLFDYVQKNRFDKGEPLTPEERNAFVRPLTMMLALKGEIRNALAVQLIADPENEEVFEYMEKHGSNPFEYIHSLASLPEEARGRNIVVLAARYMYGEKNELEVLDSVSARMESVLNADRFSVRDRLSGVTGLQFQASVPSQGM